jgi:hypothetical protein
VYGNNSIKNKTEIIYPGSYGNCSEDVISQVNLLRAYDSLLNSIGYWQNLLVFGLQHKIVTSYTSFLVLEKAEDYIKYNIAPPRELEQKCAELNYVYQSEYKINSVRKYSDNEKLINVVTNYNRRIQRWNPQASLIDLNRQVNRTAKETDPADAKIPVVNETVQMPGNLPDFDMGNNQLQEVVVTSAYSMKRSARSQSSNTQNLTAEQLNTIRTPNIQQCAGRKGCRATGQEPISRCIGKGNLDSLTRGKWTGFGKSAPVCGEWNHFAKPQ